MTIYIDGIVYSLQKGGGITRYTNELMDGLINLGHEVFLTIHPKTFNQRLKNEKLKTIEIDSILRIDSKPLRFFTYPFHKFKTERYFKGRNIKEGVFHSTYFTHYKNLKIPQVITIHDLTREKFPAYFNHISDKIFLAMTRKAILKSNAIICNSKQTANALCEYYKINPGKTNITHLGVSPAFKIRAEAERNAFRISKRLQKPYVLFVGRRATYKNFEKFADAYAAWKNRDDFSLLTVGGGKFTGNELNSMERTGLKNNITSFDFVDDEELAMFYNCAECFVFPSLSEGFGLPLLEAMACGTSILASDIPVFREVAGAIPRYFNPADKESIINALDESLKRDSAKINAGLELVKSFTWENTVKETVKVYGGLLR